MARTTVDDDARPGALVLTGEDLRHGLSQVTCSHANTAELEPQEEHDDSVCMDLQNEYADSVSTFVPLV